MICKNCKFFGTVPWDRKNPGCQQANVRYDTEGYGPWYDGAKCLHDPSKRVLKDLFEAQSETDRELLLKQIKTLDDALYEKNNIISKLGFSILKLSSETPTSTTKPSEGER